MAAISFDETDNLLGSHSMVVKIKKLNGWPNAGNLILLWNTGISILKGTDEEFSFLIPKCADIIFGRICIKEIIKRIVPKKIIFAISHKVPKSCDLHICICSGYWVLVSNKCLRSATCWNIFQKLMQWKKILTTEIFETVSIGNGTIFIDYGNFWNNFWFCLDTEFLSIFHIL